MKVILSSPLLLGNGVFKMEEISLDEAIEFSEQAYNFCGHETVKILGLKPSKTREVCTGYSQALCLKPKGRLEFGKEYTLEEIGLIGVTFQLITKIA